jgi:hypothetical protein
MEKSAWIKLGRKFSALYLHRPIPAITLDAWWETFRRPQFHYDDVAAAVQEMAEADDWPTLAKLVSRSLDIAEARARAQQELSRREAWKRAAERGIEAGPRPDVPIPPEAKRLMDQYLGRIGEDPDGPTMRRGDQLDQLQAQIDAETAAARRAGYCCPLHGRTCEPPSELCCEGCPEVYHPQHHEGAPCVLGVTSE